ncbi:homoserine kinase [Synechococcus sp. PCC 7336]|uniref:homoserine kinase n=1 Tax=Synechococcus sp. PCC 7336 TaxID=195250 RepID=UPI0003455BDD|nr:homoserine kinase [Synechococcus sp. PCC 7336]
MTQIEVVVPATTANIGPGFDCLGAALALYNHFWFSLNDSDEVNIAVRGKEDVSFGKDNLAYRAFARAFELVNRKVPGVNIEIELNVPMSRGLGSSATAIVGGLLGANALGQLNLAPETLLPLAIAVEGHPDNVVPALKGGCQLSVVGGQGRWTFCPVEWHEEIQVVAIVPNFKLSTERARDILPESVSLKDAVFTQAHLGLLLRALETGNGDWLKTALDDRLHQPYRAELIAGFKTVQTAATAAGACGVVISGAGPTLLALCRGDLRETVGEAAIDAWEQLDVKAKALYLSLDRRGGHVLENGQPRSQNS